MQLVEHPPSVAIVAIDGDDLVLVRQSRPGSDERTLEVHIGESSSPASRLTRPLPASWPRSAASRRQPFRRSARSGAAPAYSTEFVHVFEATDLHPAGEAALDEDEDVEVERVAARLAFDLVSDAVSLAALALWQRRRELSRRKSPHRSRRRTLCGRHRPTMRPRRFPNLVRPKEVPGARRVGRNTFEILLFRGVSTPLALGLVVVQARFLEPSGRGAYVIAVLGVTIVSRVLGQLGVAVTNRLGEENADARSLVHRALAIGTLLGAAGSLLVVALGRYAGQIGTDVALVAAVALIPNVIWHTISGVLLGLSRIRLWNYIQLAAPALTMVAMLVFVVWLDGRLWPPSARGHSRTSRRPRWRSSGRATSGCRSGPRPFSIRPRDCSCVSRSRWAPCTS